MFVFYNLDFVFWLVMAISDWCFKKPVLTDSQNSVCAFRGRDGYPGLEGLSEFIVAHLPV